MEDLNDRILSIIESTIIKDKPLVIDALKKSKVLVNDNISDRDLFILVTEELNSGNGYLIFHLGEVITKNIEDKSNSTGFSLSPSQLQAASQAASSGVGNSGGGGGSWLNDNSGALIGAGASILGALLSGGGSSSSPYQQSTSANQNTTLAQYQFAQQQSQINQDRFIKEQNLKEQLAKSQRNTNIIIASIIGGVVLFGTIITIAIYKKK